MQYGVVGPHQTCKFFPPGAFSPSPASTPRVTHAPPQALRPLGTCHIRHHITPPYRHKHGAHALLLSTPIPLYTHPFHISFRKLFRAGKVRCGGFAVPAGCISSRSCSRNPLNNCHFFPISWIPSYCSFDSTRQRVGNAEYDCKIRSPNCSCLELLA